MIFFHFQKRRNKDEDRSSSEPELNLYKDYTKVKPLASSSEEDNKVSQSLPDSSEDEEVFRKEQVKPTSAIHVNSKKKCINIYWSYNHISGIFDGILFASFGKRKNCKKILVCVYLKKAQYFVCIEKITHAKKNII